MTEINELKKVTDKESDAGKVYRSGVAARLAGLSVETLRVWERRYGLSETGRSARGQRLYSDDHVQHLALLKQLVDQGHQIGALVSLSGKQLQAMAAEAISSRSKTEGPIRIALIGDRLAQRMEAGGRAVFPLNIKCQFSSLEEVANVSSDSNSEVLLIELPELLPRALPLIAKARDSVGAFAVVVLYRFCASATIRQLRDQGCLVSRVPPDLREIVILCQAALAGHRRLAQPNQHIGHSTPRLFDDAALTVISSYENEVNCECPRHLADILMMVGSFERYSAQCASRNANDARLHQDLGNAASQARVILELALERLSRAEGLPLPAHRESGGSSLDVGSS